MRQQKNNCYREMGVVMAEKGEPWRTIGVVVLSFAKAGLLCAILLGVLWAGSLLT